MSFERVVHKKMTFAGHVFRGSSGTAHNEIIEGCMVERETKEGSVEPRLTT